MVATHEKRQSKGRLQSQLGDFDQDIINSNTMNGRQQNATVNEDTVAQEITVSNSDSNPAASENLLNVKTLERCFNEKIEREMGNIADTVEDKIQNANLTAADSIITPKIEWAHRSKNASSGQYVTSVMANSERGEHMGISAPFEDVSGRNNTLHVFQTKDETQKNIPDEVSDWSVPTSNHTLITEVDPKT